MLEWEWINYKGYRLEAPKGFLDSDIKDTGKCGPGQVGGMLIPDKILGLSINLVCSIHDYCYEKGENEQDQVDSDIKLFANGFRVIKQSSKYKFISFLRSIILSWYFLAVAYGGEKYFDK